MGTEQLHKSQNTTLSAIQNTSQSLTRQVGAHKRISSLEIGYLGSTSLIYDIADLRRMRCTAAIFNIFSGARDQKRASPK